MTRIAMTIGLVTLLAGCELTREVFNPYRERTANCSIGDAEPLPQLAELQRLGVGVPQ